MVGGAYELTIGVRKRPPVEMTPLQRRFTCPGCGFSPANKDGSMDKALEPPAPGKLTVCLGCTIGLRYDADLVVQLLTVPEVRILKHERPAELQRLRLVQQELRRMHAGLNKARKHHQQA